MKGYFCTLSYLTKEYYSFEGAWEPYVSTIGDLLSLLVVLCDWPQGPIWVTTLGLSIRHMEMSVNKVVRRYASPFGLEIYLLLL